MFKSLSVLLVTVIAQSHFTNRAMTTLIDQPVTYTYDAAGNRVKRLGSAGGCINTWTGNINTQWSNAGNWSMGTIPQPNHKVIIPSVASNIYPVLDINTSVSGIEFAGGSITYNISTYSITMVIDSTLSTCP